MRVDVELPNGKKVWIGGRPLMGEAELHRLFPALGKAIEAHDEIVGEVKGIEATDLEAIQRIYPRFNAAKNEICVEIINLFNDEIPREDLLIDDDTYDKILEVWSGSYQKKT